MAPEDHPPVTRDHLRSSASIASTGGHRLTVRLLGPVEIRDADDRPVVALEAQPRRVALLAFLLLARPAGFHDRDRLVAMFWPESDEAHARHALNQALHYLRRVLGADLLASRGDAEVAVAAAVWCDVLALRSALAAGDPAEVIRLYRGELLDTLHIHASPEFEQWLDGERAAVDHAVVGAAEDLLNRPECDGPAAVRYAELALDVARADEQVAVRTLRALHRLGLTLDALRLCRSFDARLTCEYELAPSTALEELKELLRCSVERGPAPDRTHLPIAEDADPAPSGSGEGAVIRETHPSPSTRAPAPARRSWFGGTRRARSLTLAGLIAAALALAAVMIVGKAYTTRRAAADYDRVLVADLAFTPDPALGMTAAEWLRAALERSDHLRPVTPAAIQNVLGRMRRPPSLPIDARTAVEIAERDGYPLVVAGELQPNGSGYLVVVRLEAAATAEVLGRYRAVAPGGESLVPALESIARGIRRHVERIPQPIRRSPALEPVTTSSVRALRLYTRAMRLREWDSRSLEAIALLEQAVREDTTFAAANRLLAVALHDRGRDRNRVAELARRAYRHSDVCGELERLEVEGTFLLHSALRDRAGPDECGIFLPILRKYDAYVRAHPDEPRPRLEYARYLERIGQVRAAIEQSQRALALDGRAADAYDGVAGLQLRAGLLDDADRTLRQWEAHLGESPTWHRCRLHAEGYRGAYQRADSIAAAQQTLYGTQSSVMIVEARLDGVRGRLREARQHLADAILRVEAQGYPELAVPWVADQALLEMVWTGDTAGARKQVRRLLRRLPPQASLGADWINVGLFHALARDSAAATAAHRRLAEAGALNWSPVRGSLQAAIASAAGNPARSLDVLLASRTPCCFEYTDARVDPRWQRVLAGRAHEALGHRDLAIREYEAYLTDAPRVLPVLLDAIFLFDTLERLGRLHEAAGDRTSAAADYARAAALGSHADPELRPRIEANRLRAATLDGS